MRELSERLRVLLCANARSVLAEFFKLAVQFGLLANVGYNGEGNKSMSNKTSDLLAELEASMEFIGREHLLGQHQSSNSNLLSSRKSRTISLSNINKTAADVNGNNDVSLPVVVTADKQTQVTSNTFI